MIVDVYAPLAAVVVAPVPVPHFTLIAAVPSAAPFTAVPAIVIDVGVGVAGDSVDSDHCTRKRESRYSHARAFDPSRQLHHCVFPSVKNNGSLDSPITRTGTISRY